MITAEQISELAKYFKIDETSIVREYLQLLFLRSFYTLKESQHVFFKGGTAIHFHYGSFRFSEDLDFSTQLSSSRIRQMLEETINDLKNEIAPLELGKTSAQQNSFNSQLKFKYKAPHILTIRLEFSQREKALTKAVSAIETRFPLISYPLVVYLDAEELLAEKVRAILMRSKGRDFFDLWYLLSKGIVLRNDYIQEKMKWCRKSYKSKDLIRAVQQTKEKELYNDLAKFLPKNYRQVITDLKKNILQKLNTHA